MIIANFEPGNDYKRVSGLTQWDYGQMLRIQGLDLPAAVEIHFSLQDIGGESITRIGTTADGVTDVIIPDSMLENEEELGKQYSVFAYIYLSNSESGETIKKIEMIVSTRPKPEAWDKPEDSQVFHQAIEAVNAAADRAEAAEGNAVQSAESARSDATKTAEDRKAVEELVLMTSDIEEQVDAVKQYKEQAATAATNAALSEQAAKTAKDAATQAQTAAETAEDVAEQHALVAAGDKAEVERMAGQVAVDKTQVAQDKADVEKAVSNFTLTAQQAIADVNNAGQAQTERVQGAGDTAIQEVNTAKDTAVKAINSAKDAAVQSITTTGQEQVVAVQEEGKRVLESIPEDYQTAMAGKVDKQQGAENAGKVLGIGEDGNVTPVEQTGGGGNTNIDQLLALAIKRQTETAETLHITDSAEFPILEIGCTGNSETNEVYKIKITACNKNLFDQNFAKNTENWIAGINYPYIPVFVGKGREVCVSYNADLQTGLGFFACISKQGGSSSSVYGWLYHSTAAGLIKKTLVFTAEQDYIFLSVSGATSSTQKFMDAIGNSLQFEINNKRTNYIGHAEQKVEISSNLPVSEGRLERRGDVYGWVTLQTEEWTPLQEEEQRALKELSTYYPETIFYTDSGLLLQVNYVADTQTYIQNNYEPKTELEDIKKRVEDLEKVAIKQEGSDKDVRYY